MVDQSLVTSGFDVEVLLSQRYLKYALLAQIEAAQLPMEIDVVDPATGVDVTVTLHPPTDYERLYEPDPGAPLPLPVDGSFDTTLLQRRGQPPVPSALPRAVCPRVGDPPASTIRAGLRRRRYSPHRQKERPNDGYCSCRRASR